jgi:flagellar M-ring protein FliF
MSLAEVEQARVHLTLPKESVFLDQQQPAKASVMVKLRAGAQISPQNVVAVTHLVASAVEGLAPESVSLLDMDGNLLSKPRKTAAADGSEITAESLEVRQQIENNLVTKISATLEPLLGAERLPRRRIRGLRPDQRRTAGRDSRSGEIGDAQFPENRRGR